MDKKERILIFSFWSYVTWLQWNLETVTNLGCTLANLGCSNRVVQTSVACDGIPCVRKKPKGSLATVSLPFNEFSDLVISNLSFLQRTWLMLQQVGDLRPFPSHSVVCLVLHVLVGLLVCLVLHVLVGLLH